MTLKHSKALQTIAIFMGYDSLKDVCWINPIGARMCDRFNGYDFYT